VSVVCMHMMSAHVAGQSTSIPSRKSSILSSRTKIDTLRLTELWRLLPRSSPSKAHCNALGSNLPGGGSCTARSASPIAASREWWYLANSMRDPTAAMGENHCDGGCTWQTTCRRFTRLGCFLTVRSRATHGASCAACHRCSSGTACRRAAAVARFLSLQPDHLFAGGAAGLRDHMDALAAEAHGLGALDR